MLPELLVTAMRNVDAVMPCGLRVPEDAIRSAAKLRVVEQTLGRATTMSMWKPARDAGFS